MVVLSPNGVGVVVVVVSVVVVVGGGGVCGCMMLVVVVVPCRLACAPGLVGCRSLWAWCLVVAR